MSGCQDVNLRPRPADTSFGHSTDILVFSLDLPRVSAAVDQLTGYRGVPQIPESSHNNVVVFWSQSEIP